MFPVFIHPFSLIIAAPSNSGKSTLAYNILKHSSQLVGFPHDAGIGFDSVWILYRSYQPLYDQMKRELGIPVFLFEKTIPDDLETLLKTSASRYPVVIVDDGICPENQTLVQDLFCRLGHHLSLSVILITQSLFDCKNSTLRICHRNTKGLIIFSCPRDQGSIRTLIHQMMPDRKKAQTLLTTVERELDKPYQYMLFDFQSSCPANQRFKTNLLGENGPYPISFVFKGG